MITNVHSSLKESELNSLAVDLKRHDTATQAAISLVGVAKENGLEDLDEEEGEPETSIDTILGVRDLEKEEDEPETSIDAILGVKDHPSEDDSSSCFSATPEPTEPVSPKLFSPDPVTPKDMSPDPEDATVMETEETVKHDENGTGETTVMTMVTVACSSQGNSPVMGRKDEERREGAEVNEVGDADDEEHLTDGLSNGENRGRSTSSTQILVTDSENTTMSITLNGYDSDDTISNEESHEELPDVPELVENGTTEEEEKPKPPVITVKETKEGRTDSSSSHGSNASNGSGNEASKLAAPENQRRRCEFAVSLCSHSPEAL